MCGEGKGGAKVNRRGFFGTLAALVAIPWVGRKRITEHRSCKTCGCLVPIEAAGLRYWGHWRDGYCSPKCAGIKIYPPGINVVYFHVKPLDKETEAAVEKIRQEFYQRYQGYENIPVGILRERA